MNNLISVIIPVYNVEQYLRRCLDSVINQTYKNLEILLIDDGSTDNSPKICDEYALKDNRIKVIHKQNGGVSSARNAGLDIAKGEYIGFVDSDDYIEPDMYEYLFNLINLEENSISVCNVKHTKKGILCPIHNNAIFFDINKYILNFRTSFFVVNKLFLSKTLKNVKFSEYIKIEEDSCFLLEVILNTNKIIYGSEVKYNYVSNPNGAIEQKFNIQHLSYFVSNRKMLSHTINNKYLHNMFFQERIYHIVGFLRKIIESDFNDKRIIKVLIKMLRKNIVLYLRTKYKLSNKLFGICCCINFNLASKIYKALYK